MGGNGAQERLTLPGTPAAELSNSGNTACCPAEIVAVVLPAGASAKSTPVPVNATLCGDPAALSVTLTDPARGPAAVGTNTTCTVQAAPTASVAPQVFEPAHNPEVSGYARLPGWQAASPVVRQRNRLCRRTGAHCQPRRSLLSPGARVTLLEGQGPARSGQPPGFGTGPRRSVCQPGCPRSLARKRLASSSSHGRSSELPHPFTTVKSPAVIRAAINCNAASPLLVKRDSLYAALAVLTAVRRSSRPAARAHPLRPAPPFQPTTRSGFLRCPQRRGFPFTAPEAVGLKTTASVHPTPAASEAPHVFAEIEKSPVMAGAPSVAATPPVFETVMFCGALVAPTSCSREAYLDWIQHHCGRGDTAATQCNGGLSSCDISIQRHHASPHPRTHGQKLDRYRAACAGCNRSGGHTCVRLEKSPETTT